MERKKKKLDSAHGQPSATSSEEVQRLFNKRFEYPTNSAWTLNNASLFKADCQGARICQCSLKKQSHVAQPDFASSAAKESDIQSSETGTGNSNDNEASYCGHRQVEANEGREFVLPGSWQHEELIQMKDKLNQLKDQLSDKEMVSWHQHTSSTNPAGKVVKELKERFRVELCTQAWCKFHEILATCDVLPSSLWDSTPSDLFSVHLCEAPGAFITSLNHFLVARDYKGKWSWLGTTLNPYYEGNDTGQMIDDDRFIRTTYKQWFFGVDNSGDLMSMENLECLLQRVKPTGGANFVTADGSIDCQENPAEQEILVSRLHHCEVLTACLILAPGGALVIKLFTLFEASSIGLMYFLNCCFDKVRVCKPATSKSGNSEVYVVCTGYSAPLCERKLLSLFAAVVGSEQPDIVLLSRNEVPDSFLEEHVKCCQYFCQLQSDTISQNIELYQNVGEEQQRRLARKQDLCVNYYVRICGLQKIDHRSRIVHSGNKNTPRRFSTVKSKGSRSHHQRNTMDTTSPRVFDSTGGTWVLPPGRFQGTFRERQQQHALSWFQLLALVPEYQVDEGCISIQCHQSLRDEQYSSWRPSTGKPFQSVSSSQFCDYRHLADMKQLLINAQLKNHQQQALTNYAESFLSKAADFLQGNHLCSHHVNTPAFTDVFHLALEGSITANLQNGAAVLNHHFLKPLESLSRLDNHHQPVGVVVDVTWPQWMAGEEVHCQSRLLDVLLDICSYVPEGSSVVLLAPVPLTRLSAGLIYILASIFKETSAYSQSDSVFLHQLFFLQRLQVPPYRLLGWLESLRHMAASSRQTLSPQKGKMEKQQSMEISQSDCRVDKVFSGAGSLPADVTEKTNFTQQVCSCAVDCGNKNRSSVKAESAFWTSHSQRNCEQQNNAERKTTGCNPHSGTGDSDGLGERTCLTHAATRHCSHHCSADTSHNFSTTKAGENINPFSHTAPSTHSRGERYAAKCVKRNGPAVSQSANPQITHCSNSYANGLHHGANKSSSQPQAHKPSSAESSENQNSKMDESCSSPRVSNNGHSEFSFGSRNNFTPAAGDISTHSKVLSAEKHQDGSFRDCVVHASDRGHYVKCQGDKGQTIKGQGDTCHVNGQSCSYGDENERNGVKGQGVAGHSCSCVDADSKDYRRNHCHGNKSPQRRKLNNKVRLEVVPVLHILNDSAFTRFLQAGNRNSVGSFVNNVKAAEQALLRTEAVE